MTTLIPKAGLREQRKQGGVARVLWKDPEDRDRARKGKVMPSFLHLPAINQRAKEQELEKQDSGAGTCPAHGLLQFDP